MVFSEAIQTVTSQKAPDRSTYEAKQALQRVGLKGALSALCADCSGELALPVAGFGKAGDVSTAM
ncbi:hypothetical protein BRC96_06565 [Halobacteriales archaeon QS_6_64_34]|nr:MAG: hypothetical protein BRC96_06565 [Halobacteriales archaeon QS_6_64_34]